jgi:hypothetical protein
MSEKTIITQLLDQVSRLDTDKQQRVLDYAAHLSRRLMTAQEILDTLLKHLTELRQFGVVKIGLFGSYSRGTSSPDSDMDFLVVLEPKTLDNLLGLQAFLEDVFQTDIDIVLEENLRDELRPYVLAETQYVKEL